MKIQCIYIIKSLASPHKFYIGSAMNFISRKWRHLYDLKHNTHSNIVLQSHVNKYGLEDLYFEILQVVLNKEDLLTIEQQYLDGMKPTFNICKIAGSWFGVKMREETKQKIRDSITGRKLSEDHKEKIRQAAIGRKRKEFSAEWKTNLSKSKVGNTNRRNKKYPGTRPDKRSKTADFVL